MMFFRFSHLSQSQQVQNIYFSIHVKKQTSTKSKQEYITCREGRDSVRDHVFLYSLSQRKLYV